MADPKPRLDLASRPSRVRPIVATVVGVGLVLAIGFSAWAIVGIRSMRSALVTETERQSLALLESLILASQYSLASGALVERLERETLAERVRLLLDNDASFHPDSQNLASLASTLEVDGLTLWLGDSTISYPSPNLSGIALDSELHPEDWDETEDAVSLSERDSITQQAWNGVGFATRLGPVIVWKTAKPEGSNSAIGGIGELIQQIGRQSGVNYIMLQAPDGIVFASRPLKPVLKLASDSFLVSVLESDVAATRELTFEGVKVLEAAAPFLSTELPSGMFRVGLSLNAADEAVSRLTLQLGLSALLMLLLATTVSAIVLTRRSLADLGQSYRAVETLTGRVLDSINQAVIATDAEGKITIFNPTAEQWFGVRLDTVRGHEPGTVIPADFGLEEVRSGRQPQIDVETRCRTNLGERILVYSTTPLSTADTVRGGAVAVIRDETESRALAVQVRRAERLSAMGQLAAGVAHEIRNPLNAIALAAQQLKLEAPNAESAGMADTIWGESKRLNLIVEDFLSLARPSSQPHLPVNWTEVIGSVAQMATLEADKKQVALNINLGKDSVILGVADELRKAVWNLLHNALAATPSGGTIDVALTLVGGSSELTIDDSGSGIAPDALPRVFEPWFTTKSGGTGLGLAITHRIIQDHGGTIEIVSPVPEHREGTRAIVRLPIASSN